MPLDPFVAKWIKPQFYWKFCCIDLACIPWASARIFKGRFLKEYIGNLYIQDFFPFDCNWYVCNFLDCDADYCGDQ